jgi:hypothetical protein
MSELSVGLLYNLSDNVSGAPPPPKKKKRKNSLPYMGPFIYDEKLPVVV